MGENPDGGRCVPLDLGNGVVASAHVHGDLSDEDRDALAAIIRAAIAKQEARDAADPEAARRRTERLAANRERIRRHLADEP